ncbi:tRNA pseudouridine(38-40) synthase TruA [Phycisphaeraceae bacterium D3-23]
MMTVHEVPPTKSQQPVTDAPPEQPDTDTPRDATADPAPRYKLTLAYDGSAFHGWQKQNPPGEEPLRTVQGELEAVLVRLLNTPTYMLGLLGASRTDSGVHALGQVAQFDAHTPIPTERLAKAINARLPEDMEVRTAEVAVPGFDCIGGVTNKQYRYRIFNAEHKPLWQRNAVYHCFGAVLDVVRMQDAARRLVGKHDVEGFAAAGHGRADTVRSIYDCQVFTDVAYPNEIHITIQGSGFLYNMVRIIAGTLIEVGRGRFDPDQIDRVLDTADRRLAGPTLPPQGLCLEWIRY